MKRCTVKPQGTVPYPHRSKGAPQTARNNTYRHPHRSKGASQTAKYLSSSS